MQKKNRTELFNTSTLVYLALLIAINIVLMRIFRLELGAVRVSIGHISTIMAGLWFGPVCGAICGLTADILGCFLDGYAVNPLISLAAMMWGIIPAVMLSKVRRGRRSAVITVSVVITCVISAFFLTTAGLVLMLGYELHATVALKIPQTLLSMVVYSVLAVTLYLSPVTRMVKTSSFAGRYRKSTA